MTYPPRPTRQHDFSNDEARGLTSPDPSKLDAEIDNIVEAVTKLRTVQVGITTASGQLKPNQTVNASLTEINDPDEFTAAGGTPETFTFTTAIDSTVNDVHVYVGGALVAPSDVTFDNTTVSVNTTAGQEVVVHFYDQQDSTLTQLAATGTGEGADLVGYADASNYGAQVPITGTATTVTEGLDLALQNIDGLGDDFYPVTQWVRTDGTNPLTADWDVGGTFRISNHPASTATGEVVVHQQLVALQSTFDGLGATYLALDGSSVMAGDLDLGNNNVINLAAATASGQAVEYDQYTTALATKLSIDGSIAMTGTLDMGTNSIDNVVDPTTAQQAATKAYVDAAVGGVSGPKNSSNTYMMAARVDVDNATATSDTQSVIIDLDDRTVTVVPFEASLLQPTLATAHFPTDYINYGCFGAFTSNDSPSKNRYYGVNFHAISYDTATTTLTISATEQINDNVDGGSAITTDFDVIADGTFKTLVSMPRFTSDQGAVFLQVSYDPVTDALQFRVTGESAELNDPAIAALHFLLYDD